MLGFADFGDGHHEFPEGVSAGQRREEVHKPLEILAHLSETHKHTTQAHNTYNHT